MSDEVLEDGQEPEVQETAPVEQSESQGPNDGYSLADEFLSSIPDETQKLLLQPHVKNWDAQVTKKFQSIHDEYKPFKELGADPDTLRRAYSFMQQVESSPQQVFQALAEAMGVDLGGYQQYLQAQQQPPQQQPSQPEQPSPYADYPEPLAQQFNKYDETFSQIQQVLGQLLESSQQSEQQKARARADYEIDQLLTNLEQQHGKFDQQYVLLQMYNGVTPEQAIQNWKNMIQSHAQQLQAPIQEAPRVMSSGGAPPAAPNGFDPGKAGNKDVETMIASILQAQAQGR